MKGWIAVKSISQAGSRLIRGCFASGSGISLNNFATKHSEVPMLEVKTEPHFLGTPPGILGTTSEGDQAEAWKVCA
jgi:hypothetical protein